MQNIKPKRATNVFCWSQPTVLRQFQICLHDYNFLLTIKTARKQSQPTKFAVNVPTREYLISH